MPLIKRLLLASAFALTAGVAVFERVAVPQSQTVLASEPLGDGDAPDKPVKYCG